MNLILKMEDDEDDCRLHFADCVFSDCGFMDFGRRNVLFVRML
jgi:hypothetical protein